MNALKRLLTVVLTALILTFCLPTALAAPNMEVAGSANVRISALSANHSTGASAGVARDGDCRAILEAELPYPGAWASFTLTVENCGDDTAVLSQVLQQDDTPEDILISFGIADADTGEMLAAGDTCTFTIVAQVNPDVRSSSLGESGSFALTLVYDAVGGSTDAGNSGSGSDSDRSPGDSPQTGDCFPLFTLFLLMTLSLASLWLLRKRRTNGS